ncbi:hypothetical protein Dimus_024756, partial [Dionaea muscipula]
GGFLGGTAMTAGGDSKAIRQWSWPAVTAAVPAAMSGFGWAVTWSAPVASLCMDVMQRLRILKRLLWDFHRCHFSGIDAHIQAARDRLNQLKVDLRIRYSNEGLHAVGRMNDEYRELILAKERILKQKLKKEWFACMDRGTPYFYSLLKSRRRRSRISRVVTENGHIITDDKGIGEEFIGYF